MTGYQTTGSPQEASFGDQAAWDRAFDAAYDHAEARGLELSQRGLDDLVREVLSDPDHKAWDAYYAEQARASKAKAATLHPVMTQALAPFAPLDEVA